MIQKIKQTMMTQKISYMLFSLMLIIREGVSVLTKDKIQIQSEKAEIYFRNIKIKSINQLPN